VSLLEKLGYDESYHFIAREVALQWDTRDGDVFEDLRSYVRYMPEREKQRVRRIQQLEESENDDTTHPSITRRVALLQTQHVNGATVTYSPQEHEVLLAQLRPLEREMQRHIIRQHLTPGERMRVQRSI
jgi:hypothetical protein